jgi:hypothetical protein
MRKIKVLLVFFLILGCETKKTSQYNEPYIYLNSYSLSNNGLYYTFSYSSLDDYHLIEEIDNNYPYSIDSIYFIGYINGSSHEIISGKLISDLEEYAIRNHYLSGYSISFVEDKIISVKIFSDSTFNDIEAGKSLNHLFSVSGHFIIVRNNKYVLDNKLNILDSNILKDSIIHFPREISIKLVTPPQKEMKYNFYIELITDDNYTATSLFSNIILKGH